jgi:hypothetical protein
VSHSDLECLEALKSLRAGEIDKWHGLIAGCSRQTAEEVFGNTGSEPDGAAILGDELTAFRGYGPSEFAPNGFTVWFQGDAIRCVQVGAPKLVQPLETMIGRPEAIVPSRLKKSLEQHIYASRGLIAHVDIGSHAVFSIYFCEPTTVEEFLESSISRVEIRRIPLR